jgi:hypothetical protein
MYHPNQQPQEEHLPPSWALKMEAVCSSETSVFTYEFARSYNQEDQYRHLHRLNLKSHSSLRSQNLAFGPQ